MRSVFWLGCVKNIMNRKIFNYFEIAAQTAVLKNDERNFLLGSVGIRSDGTMVKSFNSSAVIPMPAAHSERRLAAKLDYGAVVYVARVRLIDGCWGMAKPCQSCMAALTAKKVSKIYYTISHKEYGVIIP